MNSILRHSINVFSVQVSCSDSTTGSGIDVTLDRVGFGFRTLLFQVFFIQNNINLSISFHMHYYGSQDGEYVVVIS